MLLMPTGSEDDLKHISYGKGSHQELPYLIHSKTNVPYLVGKHGHTIIAVELKKFGWKIKLAKNNDDRYIVARKGKERWAIQVIAKEMQLSELLRSVKGGMNKEIDLFAEEIGAHPVLALVAQDSATLISARTFIGLSPAH